MSRSNLINGMTKEVIRIDNGRSVHVAGRPGLILYEGVVAVVVAFRGFRGTKKRNAVPAQTVAYSVYSKTAVSIYATEIARWKTRRVAQKETR